MKSFAVGDIVRLKSGGPDMVVVYVATDTVDVNFFDKKNTFTSLTLKPAALMFIRKGEGDVHAIGEGSR